MTTYRDRIHAAAVDASKKTNWATQNQANVAAAKKAKRAREIEAEAWIAEVRARKKR